MSRFSEKKKEKEKIRLFSYSMFMVKYENIPVSFFPLFELINSFVLKL